MEMGIGKRSIVLGREFFVGPLRPGEFERGWMEVDSNGLLALTKDRDFLGMGDLSSGASLLVRYASYGKDGEYCAGYGLFV